MTFDNTRASEDWKPLDVESARILANLDTETWCALVDHEAVVVGGAVVAAFWQFASKDYDILVHGDELPDLLLVLAELGWEETKSESSGARASVLRRPGSPNLDVLASRKRPEMFVEDFDIRCCRGAFCPRNRTFYFADGALADLLVGRLGEVSFDPGAPSTTPERIVKYSQRASNYLYESAR